MTVEELIKKYPKIFEPYEGNPYEVNWHGLPIGWVEVIDNLCGSIQDYIDRKRMYVDKKWVQIPQVNCTQMKEKFAELRFYFYGGDDEVEGMVRMGMYMCKHTCQQCGGKTDGVITTINGWMFMFCENCKNIKQ